MVRTRLTNREGGEGKYQTIHTRVVPETGWNMEGSKLFSFRSQKQWK